MQLASVHQTSNNHPTKTRSQSVESHRKNQQSVGGGKNISNSFELFSRTVFYSQK